MHGSGSNILNPEEAMGKILMWMPPIMWGDKKPMEWGDREEWNPTDFSRISHPLKMTGIFQFEHWTTGPHLWVGIRKPLLSEVQWGSPASISQLQCTVQSSLSCSRYPAGYLDGTAALWRRLAVSEARFRVYNIGPSLQRLRIFQKVPLQSMTAWEILSQSLFRFPGRAGSPLFPSLLLPLTMDHKLSKVSKVLIYSVVSDSLQPHGQ